MMKPKAMAICSGVGGAKAPQLRHDPHPKSTSRAVPTTSATTAFTPWAVLSNLSFSNKSAPTKTKYKKKYNKLLERTN